MSRQAAKVSLSPQLKALIAKPEAQGAPPPAPPFAETCAVLQSVRQQSESLGFKNDSYLVLCAATICAIASPDTLCQLYDFATKTASKEECAHVAAILRETGLKCITFSGAPTAINNLNALRAHLADDVVAQLPNVVQREPSVSADLCGKALFDEDDIYPMTSLQAAHPDLPAYVLNHYASLLAVPQNELPHGSYRMGRTLTALVGAAAVRATGGQEELEPFLDALASAATTEGTPLATEDALIWIVQSVDQIGSLFNSTEDV